MSDFYLWKIKFYVAPVRMKIKFVITFWFTTKSKFYC